MWSHLLGLFHRFLMLVLDYKVKGKHLYRLFELSHSNRKVGMQYSLYLVDLYRYYKSCDTLFVGG